MALFPPPPRLTHRVALIVVGCTALGVLLTATSYFYAQMAGLPFEPEYAVMTMTKGWVWIPLIPLILSLAERYPLWWRRWRDVGVHLVGGSFCGACAGVLYHAVKWPLIGGAPETWGERALHIAAELTSQIGYDLMWYFILIAVVAAVGHFDNSVRYLERLRAREVRAARLESELAQAQLHALRMQLNPHFLFNTLSAASALTTRDPQRARRVIVDLGELLRLALDTTDEEVPLRDELVFLDRYLRIEGARMGDRLHVRVKADEGVLDALVPPLLLQPLVENAVKHGVAALEEGGAVEVEAVREGGDLVLRVRDTGPGLPEGAAPCGGIGLHNVRRRLEGLYGAAAAISLESPPGAGLTATVRLPFRTTEAPASPVSTA